jgi:hypothetical protein
MAPNSATASGTSSPSTPDVDPQIIEALKSKDRIYVLKLGELMEGLIKEKRYVFPCIHLATPSRADDVVVVAVVAGGERAAPPGVQIAKIIMFGKSLGNASILRQQPRISGSWFIDVLHTTSSLLRRTR